MLRAKAEILFTLSDKNYTAREDFRVPFNFGEDLLFSGNIKSDHEEYLSQEDVIQALRYAAWNVGVRESVIATA